VGIYLCGKTSKDMGVMIMQVLFGRFVGFSGITMFLGACGGFILWWVLCFFVYLKLF